MLATYWEKGRLQSVLYFAAMTSIYNRDFGVKLFFIYLITSKTGVGTQQCNDSPVEVQYSRRCWAPHFAFDMTGITYHHCILTCRMIRECQFLSYHFTEGRCQFTSVCVALLKETGVPWVETVLFGKVELLNECANWIPATEHGDNRGLKCNRAMGFVARLNTDKNIILGSILYPNF